MPGELQTDPSTRGGVVDMTEPEDLLTRMKALLEEGEALVEKSEISPLAFLPWYDEVLHLLALTVGTENIYYEGMKHRHDHYKGGGGYAKLAVAMLARVIGTLERGELTSIRNLAASDVHGSLLEQAEYLLKETYHVPAASLAGAVLENHLVKLAQKSNLTWKGYHTIGKMNDLLRDEGVYTEKDHSEVNSLQGTRDYVDHHEFEKTQDVNPERVRLMIERVRLFMDTHPL
jgi:hypothetical protein